MEDIQVVPWKNEIASTLDLSPVDKVAGCTLRLAARMTFGLYFVDFFCAVIVVRCLQPGLFRRKDCKVQNGGRKKEEAGAGGH